MDIVEMGEGGDTWRDVAATRCRYMQYIDRSNDADNPLTRGSQPLCKESFE